MGLFLIIIFVWIVFALLGLIRGNARRMRKEDETGRAPMAVINDKRSRQGRKAAGDEGRTVFTADKNRDVQRNRSLRNTIPEPGTIADWIRRSGMMGTQTSLSALEDRENDWLAQEIRLEKGADNEFISEMKKLKLEHKRVHNRLHGN